MKSIVYWIGLKMKSYISAKAYPSVINQVNTILPMDINVRQGKGSPLFQ